jgi:tRNA nucleotidyltransferase/poly(A) polymerase
MSPDGNTCYICDMLDKFNTVRDQLDAKYNTSFLDDLFSINNLNVYLFGGALRDIAFGKDWKEADIRITFPASIEEREAVMDKALQGIKIDEKIVLKNLDIIVYRFLPVGSTTKCSVDLSVASSLEGNLPDFTINSLYYNLKTKEVVDRFAALQDIEHRILRTCYDPMIQFSERPDTIFRAVKAVVSNDLSIEVKTLEALKQNCSNIVKVLDVVRNNKKGLLLELTQSDMFRGLKYNPHAYFELFNELGLMNVFIKYLSKGISAEIAPVFNPFDTSKKYEFEDAISIFISIIAKGTDNPEKSFDQIIELLSLNRKPEYTDFVIDHTKIKFVS